MDFDEPVYDPELLEFVKLLHPDLDPDDPPGNFIVHFGNGDDVPPNSPPQDLLEEQPIEINALPLRNIPRGLDMPLLDDANEEYMFPYNDLDPLDLDDDDNIETIDLTESLHGDDDDVNNRDAIADEPAPENEPATPAGKRFACPMRDCVRVLKSFSGMKQHIQKVHHVPASELKLLKPHHNYICSYCLKGYKSIHGMRRHMPRHEIAPGAIAYRPVGPRASKK